jgi:hypothetical protein
MKSLSLRDIEKQIAQLSPDEQLLLIERLNHRLRNDAVTEQIAWERDLAAMAADPEIQSELRKIDAEFRVTEGDALSEGIIT